MPRQINLSHVLVKYGAPKLTRRNCHDIEEALSLDSSEREKPYAFHVLSDFYVDCLAWQVLVCCLIDGIDFREALDHIASCSFMKRVKHCREVDVYLGEDGIFLYNVLNHVPELQVSHERISRVTGTCTSKYGVILPIYYRAAVSPGVANGNTSGAGRAAGNEYEYVYGDSHAGASDDGDYDQAEDGYDGDPFNANPGESEGLNRRYDYDGLLSHENDSFAYNLDDSTSEGVGNNSMALKRERIARVRLKLCTNNVTNYYRFMNLENAPHNKNQNGPNTEATQSLEGQTKTNLPSPTGTRHPLNFSNSRSSIESTIQKGVFEPADAGRTLPAAPTFVDSMARNDSVQLLIGTLNVNDADRPCIEGCIVEVDIEMHKDCQIYPGMYCRGHVVVVVGKLDLVRNVLVIYQIRHPIHSGDVDGDATTSLLFGGNLTSAQLVAMEMHTMKMLSIGAGAIASKWIVIAHVKLDLDSSLKMLRTVFTKLLATGKDEPFPAGIILVGDFCSKGTWHDRKNHKSFIKAFNGLIRVLSKPAYSILVNRCRLIFVPSQNDPIFCPNILPMGPMLKKHWHKLIKKVTSLHPGARLYFGSNPTRLRHGPRRLVIFRHNTSIQLLSQSLIRSPVGCTDDYVNMIMETIQGQAHLCPAVLPVRMDHQAPLVLYPKPNVVGFISCFPVKGAFVQYIMADETAPQFLVKNQSCTYCNLAKDFGSSGTFVAYDAIRDEAGMYTV